MMPAVACLETPILFTGPNVLKVMGRTKWQTRRPVVWRNRPLLAFMDRAWVDPGGTELFGPGPYLKVPCRHPEDPVGRDCERELRVHSPYGYPGDRLWVRETHKFVEHWPEYEEVEYRADGATKCWKTDEIVAHTKKWRPSIFLPRWACRTLLVVTRIRLERLQEITDADIRAEGLACPEHDFSGGFCAGGCGTLRKAWLESWDKINGKRGFLWKKNPMVWVIDFMLSE